jgi:hypothetical protein
VESNALRLNTIPPPSPPPDVRSSPILPISHAQSPEMVGSSPDLPSHATPLRSVAEIPVKEISNTNTGEPFDSTKAMQLLDPPLAFNRPPSRLSSFIRLDTMRFTELNSFTLGRIKIPFILDDHDIYRDDWIMFIHASSVFYFHLFPSLTPPPHNHNRIYH